MAGMTNYRDISSARGEAPGFQFEFYCEVTGETWKSPFKPYRRGQIFGAFSKLTYWFYQMHSASRVAEHFADSGAEKARQAALLDAMEMASRRFTPCQRCNKWVINTALDDHTGRCPACMGKRIGNNLVESYSETPEEEPASAAALCPNCQTPSQGGRFCHECGFDMASVFKSCPSCGITLPRQARFCTDCGHGF